MKPRVDTLKEKIELLKYLKSRLKALQKQEKESGKFLPEVRETCTAICTVCEKIRLEGGNYQPTVKELRENVFGDWRKKED